MSHALLAIQNILQNSNIFSGSRETVLFTPFGSRKVTQFSGLPPTSVSTLREFQNKLSSQSPQVIYLNFYVISSLFKIFLSFFLTLT